MAKAPKGQQQPETFSNAYTRQELEDLAGATGLPFDTLKLMTRSQVRRAASEAAERIANQGIEQQRLDAEARRAVDMEKNKATQDKLASERPMVERYPLINTITSAASIAVPPLMGLASRRWGGEQKFVRQWDKSIADAERLQQQARSSTGSVADAASATERAQAFANQYKAGYGDKSKLAAGLNDAKVIAGGTVLASEIPVLPALADVMMYEPGTRAYDEASRKLTLDQFKNRMIAAAPIAGGTTALGLKAGILMNRNPMTSMARTEALIPQSRPGWGAMPQTMAANYAGAANSQQQLMDAQLRLALSRQDGERLLRLPADMPPNRPALLPTMNPHQSAPPSQPQPVSLQSPSPPQGPVAAPNVAQMPQPRQLPAPDGSDLPPAGPWSQYWSPAARDTVMSHVGGGGSIAKTKGLTGRELMEGIEHRISQRHDAPGLAETSARLKRLRETVGDNPTQDSLRQVFARDPEGRLFSIPLGLGAGGLGLMALSPDEAQAQGYRPGVGPRRGLWDE